MDVIKGAVGPPTLMLELFVEGLQAASVVDTASNSTIISRPMLHSIASNVRISRQAYSQTGAALYAVVWERRDQGKASRNYSPSYAHLFL